MTGRDKIEEPLTKGLIPGRGQAPRNPPPPASQSPAIQVATQEFPYPHDLQAAVDELRYLPGWMIYLSDEDRGQGCRGLTLNIHPNKMDSYKPSQHVGTRFLYPVPAAAYNRESWEEWIWARIEETEGHERAEWFRFGEAERRPFKPAHPDGWDPGVVRSVVSETVVNTPNAGRLVTFPCKCGHRHRGRMGEHFAIEQAYPCDDKGCPCDLGLKTLLGEAS